ncbi:hypothetical protein QTO17_05470, partial [Vibrio owensii]
PDSKAKAAERASKSAFISGYMPIRDSPVLAAKDITLSVTPSSANAEVATVKDAPVKSAISEALSII